MRHNRVFLGWISADYIDFGTDTLDQSVDAALLVDDRAKFGSLRNHHANAFDDDVDDVPAVVLSVDHPIDIDGRSLLTRDLAANRRHLVVRPASSADIKLLAIVGIKPAGVCRDDIVFEKRGKLILLCRCSPTPMSTHDKAADRRHVEAFDEQLPKNPLAIAGAQRPVGK